MLTVTDGTGSGAERPEDACDDVVSVPVPPESQAVTPLKIATKNANSLALIRRYAKQSLDQI
jgi:hypothetical protein